MSEQTDIEKIERKIMAFKDQRPLVYIVMGTTGEYSDRSEWPVRVHKTELDAIADVAWLEHKYLQVPSNEDAETKRNYMLEYDPNFSRDYTGTSWFVMEAPFIA